MSASEGSGGGAWGPLAWFRDRSVRTKLTLLIGVNAVIAGVVVFFAVSAFGQLTADVDRIRQQGLVPVRAIDHVATDILQERVLILSHVASPSLAGKAAYEDKLTQAREVTDQHLEDFEAAATPAQLRTAQQVRDKLTAYRTMISGEYAAASRRGDLATVERLRDSQATPMVKEITELIDGLGEQASAAADEAVASAQATASRARRLVITLIGIGTLLVLVMGTLTARYVVRPLCVVEDVLAAMRGGDLTRRAQVGGRDEIGRMASALDDTTQGLATALSGVADSASLVGHRIA